VAAHREVAIIHDQRAGKADIDAELGRNLHDMGAALEDGGREVSLLGPEDIGRLRRMPEGRQHDGVIGQFNTDQLAAARHLHLVNRVPLIKRDLALALGRIGPVALADGFDRVDGEHETGAERMTGAHQGAEVHRLGNAFCADGEKSPHVRIP
jgi:hypothetical protein